MPWTKAPAEMEAAFAASLPTDAAIQRRKMFGYPCAIVNGHMFAGLHAESMVLRLPDDELRQFLALDGATPFEPMPGRPMKSFAVVPQTLLADPRSLRDWVERAFVAAAALAPKAAGPRARAKRTG